MPLCAWKISPCHLVSRYPPLQPSPTTATTISTLRKDDFSKLYKSQNDLVNTACVSMLKQLMDVTGKVGILFADLQDEVTSTFQRSVDLQNRMIRLKSKIADLNPIVDKISLDDTLQCKPYKSGTTNNRANSKRPQFVAEVFSRIEATPSFHLLDPFKSEKEKERSKLYSDANFFFESWCSQVEQEVDKKPAKKKARAKKEKAEVKRKPVKANFKRIQNRMKSEMIGGGETKGCNIDEDNASKKDEISQKDGYSKDGSSKTNDDESILSVCGSMQSSQTTPIIPTPQTPNLPSPPNFDSDDFTTFPPLPPNPNPNSNFDQNWLPPPPVVSPKPKRGTLYEVSDFNPNSSILPPIPLPIPSPNHNPQYSHNVPAPPPLPPVVDSFTMSVPTTTTTPTKEKKPITRQHSRSDFLSAIKKGMELRKVDENEKIKPTSDNNTGLFDVERIMEMRRRALEDDDDEEEDDEDDDWND